LGGHLDFVITHECIVAVSPAAGLTFFLEKVSKTVFPLRTRHPWLKQLSGASMHRSSQTWVMSTKNEILRVEWTIFVAPRRTICKK
jgi:hypothetical protein